MDHEQKRITQIFIDGLENAPESPVPTGPTFSKTPAERIADLGSETPGKLQKQAIFRNNAAATNKYDFPRIRMSRKKVGESLKLRMDSPWNFYTKVLDLLDLGGDVAVAVGKRLPAIRVHIREFPKKESEKTLHWVQRLRHSNIVAALEVFRTPETLFIVFEEMDFTLEHIAKSVTRPSETQLAAILGQILDGLIYLQNQGFEHSSLAYKNILIDADGEVKIGKSYVPYFKDPALTAVANQQYCQNVSSGGITRDIRILGDITMRLMQIYENEHLSIGVDTAQRWPRHPNAIAFLSLTTSASSLVELLELTIRSIHYWQNNGRGIRDGKRTH
ncbi:serine/threonine protein kinase [Apiospora phragmitis]|uniref:Serine/threonine protein kinase n=1 Tax=Apiospora phragmitis TaxID=2905665 RepID=A0ABR1SVM5_9PEZI